MMNEPNNAVREKCPTCGGDVFRICGTTGYFIPLDNAQELSDTQKHLTACQQRLAIAEEALGFYSNEDNYFLRVDAPHGVTMSFTGGSPIDIDKGKTATEALEKMGAIS